MTSVLVLYTWSCPADTYLEWEQDGKPRDHILALLLHGNRVRAEFHRPFRPAVENGFKIRAETVADTGLLDGESNLAVA